jgi:hypothetical protein
MNAVLITLNLISFLVFFQLWIKISDPFSKKDKKTRK